jgi:hypothetical protein
MTFPSSPYKFNSFEDALDDLIEDWAGEESEQEIVNAMQAKIEEMQMVPETKVSEEKPNAEEEDQG